MATQRLFFALWPQPELQKTLHRLGRELLDHAPGRLVVAENLHLTLAFLGSVDRTVRACLEQAAGEIRGEPFTLRFDRAGWFPRPRVFWLGCPEAPTALAALVEVLRSAQRNCSLQPELRPYVPHLTLARKVSRAPDVAPFPVVEWPVAGFTLVESCTGAEGVRYTPLREWRLFA